MTRRRSAAPPTARVGERAEAAARRYLEARGLEVVACNYRCRAGELDLVMLHDAVLVVVEVRYRERIDTVTPAATITPLKRRRLARAAAHFLQRQPRFRDHAVRFDVLGLTGSLDAVRCDWIRCAFTLDDVAGF